MKEAKVGELEKGEMMEDEFLAAPKITSAQNHGSEDNDMEKDSGSVTSSSSSFTAEDFLQLGMYSLELDKKTNSWSEPLASNFYIRGPNYFEARHKIRSDPFLLPMRGAELFLTEECPENVGRSNMILGGKLRTAPTFIVNFRFPWGLLVLSFDIPSKFLPFLHCRYSDDKNSQEQQLINELDLLTPPERTFCRFLMKDDVHKQKTLKLVPVVVEGPWVVRNMIAGKPVIIGNKLPVSYHYGSPDKARGLAEYLELDLDIGSSSTKAKGIVSACQRYMNSITADIGIVIQGNTNDELPEQMLCCARLHQLNAETAPSFSFI